MDFVPRLRAPETAEAETEFIGEIIGLPAVGDSRKVCVPVFVFGVPRGDAVIFVAPYFGKLPLTSIEGYAFNHANTPTTLHRIINILAIRLGTLICLFA